MTKEKSLDEVKGEEKVRQCPECKSTDIVHEDDEFFCKKCGLVLE